MSNIDRGATLPATGQPGDVFVLTGGASGQKVYVWTAGAWELQTSATSDSLTEGTTNQYFTAARAVAAVAASPKITLAAAPADGAISASECYIWFDHTNGAAAINFKGKSANGTVVSGTVALS